MTEILTNRPMSKETATKLGKKLGLVGLHAISFGRFHPGKNHQQFTNAVRNFQIKERKNAEELDRGKTVS